MYVLPAMSVESITALCNVHPFLLKPSACCKVTTGGCSMAVNHASIIPDLSKQRSPVPTVPCPSRSSFLFGAGPPHEEGKIYATSGGLVHKMITTLSERFCKTCDRFTAQKRCSPLSSTDMTNSQTKTTENGTTIVPHQSGKAANDTIKRSRSRDHVLWSKFDMT